MHLPLHSPRLDVQGRNAKILSFSGYFLLFVVALCSSSTAFAIVFSSPSFEIFDPVLFPAGYATSSGYSLTSTVGQLAIGTSTAGAGTARENRSGFEYFPYVNNPVLGATAGNAQVQLSWTASVGILGWNVSGYQVGQSGVSGGPYTPTNVGVTLSNTQTGLTNGTPYYFVVRVLDAFGNIIATSSEVTATPSGVVTPPPPPPSSGGGGSAYVAPTPDGTLVVLGRAYPSASVNILRDGAIVSTVNALSSGDFYATLTLPSGSYQLGFSAKDSLGRFSSLLTMPVVVVGAKSITLGGIFLSPTLDLDKRIVSSGDSVGVSGYAYPGSSVALLVSLDPTLVSNVRVVELPVAADGRYTYRFFTTDFTEGLYVAKTKSTIKQTGESSVLSSPELFIITSDESKKKPERLCRLGDLNDDTRVNLVDFSIATYWNKKVLRVPFIAKEAECLNNDGKVDLYDFSLMAYFWTG